MRIRIVPFDPRRHLDAAADLLAQRQRRLRTIDHRLPAAYESPSECRPLIEAHANRPDATGVVAEIDGAVSGYAFMWAFLPAPTDLAAGFFPARTAHTGYDAQAAREDVAFDVYREMYAALAHEYVQRGIYDHIAYTSPHDAAANEAYVSLGFGRQLVAAVRGVDPVEAPAAAEIHEAGPEDLAVISQLNKYLWQHHTTSPIFWPMMPEPLAAEDAFQRALLDDTKTNPHFVAYRDAEALGTNTFMPPDWVTPVLRPERTVYLYQGIVSPSARGGGIGQSILAQGVAWAREQGFEHVALHFWAPNISGARFWLGQGFQPVEYRLVRHVDERIAWAR